MKRSIIARSVCGAVILALYVLMFFRYASVPRTFDYGMAYDMYCIGGLIIYFPVGCLVSGIIGGFAYSRHGIWSLAFAGVTVISVVLSVLIYFRFYDSYLWMLIYPAIIAVGYGAAMIIKYWATSCKRTDGSGFKWRWI